MADLFEQAFTERVAPLLENPDDYPEAISALEDIMPEMQERVDRSRVYHWLGNVYLLAAIRALSQQDGKAREHFDHVEEFFVKAIEEYYWRHDTRVALGRFYLSQGGRPDTALECLLPTANPEDDAEAWPAAAYEHQALGLAGTACAQLDKRDQAIWFWTEAFDPRFHEPLDQQGPDLTPLLHAAVGGFRMAPTEARPILDLAAKFPGVDRNILADLTRGLVDG